MIAITEKTAYFALNLACISSSFRYQSYHWSSGQKLISGLPEVSRRVFARSKSASRLAPRKLDPRIVARVRGPNAASRRNVWSVGKLDQHGEHRSPVAFHLKAS